MGRPRLLADATLEDLEHAREVHGSSQRAAAVLGVGESTFTSRLRQLRAELAATLPKVDRSNYFTVDDLAAARKIGKRSIHNREYEADLARAELGARPADRIPEPDLRRDPDTGRPLLLWLKTRPDVQAYMAGGIRNSRPPELDNPEWLRALYWTPDGHPGQSEYYIASVLGVTPPTVLAALERLGIPLWAGRRTTVTREQALAAVERCGTRKAAARELGVSPKLLTSILRRLTADGVREGVGK